MSKYVSTGSTDELLIYPAANDAGGIRVLLAGETVWLTQAQIAELYQTTKQNISLHVRNIHAESELRPEATVKQSLTVRQEGKRQVQRPLEYYNLDMILAFRATQTEAKKLRCDQVHVA
ncbi:hypothetical protein [Thermomonas sp.]|uniref:hypothetical protein n=1 Tax=Thermomonas sp. TaxID=1971895 RepID=UPI002488E806|nr:hypothetical protein [Thermomonas sp.]MDI1254095.1 hypothetical protein [Thermomonas sp.]